MQRVFTELKLTNSIFRNRIARSATNDYAGNEDGTVNPTQLEINRALAQHEVGLIFTGHYAVCPQGHNDPRQNALWDDKFIAGHHALTDLVHQFGGKIVAQINHSGAQAQLTAIAGTPVAPSAVEKIPGILPRALTIEEIQQVEADFAAAAFRAKQAGYDGVQVHCAHGYLFSEFIDPAYNKRTDAYGGSAENRFRIAAETIQKIKAVCGAEYPVFLKIHTNVVEGQDAFPDELADMLRTAKALGVEAAELSGWDFPRKKPEERLYYLEAACQLRAKIDLPLILVGGVRTLAEMEQVLASGIDMVSMSRPFICQSDIVPRLKAGEESRCIGCFGCFSCYQKSGKRCVLH